MKPWKPSHAAVRAPLRSAALRRPDLVQVLGGEYSDDRTGPVGDRIPEEASGMRTGIGAPIETDPKRKEAEGGGTQDGPGDKRALDLRAWWSLVEQTARAGGVLIGFNIARFDVPFLLRRSWSLRVPVPAGVFNGRSLNHHVVLDLYEEWQAGDRGEMISLKRLPEYPHLRRK